MSEIIIIIRPSFMKFCQDGCRAALFNHILYWIAWKAKDQAQEAVQSGEITYFATTDELVEHMAGAWGSKKIRLEVNALVEMGLIGRGRNPKFGADRTKHFSFVREQYTKLVELCKKHHICLAHIGLQKEIINLLAAFDESIECPCTGQMVNLPNANGKLPKCSEHEQMVKSPFANGKLTGAITKITTKITKNKDNDERKKEPAREVNIPTGQESHSFIHSFIHSQNQSSLLSEPKETKPEEEKPAIVFSPEAEQVYGFAKEINLVALKWDENHREYCDTLVKKGITTLEQMTKLKRYCEQLPLFANKDDKRICLKNLINALPGWLQTQEKKPATVGTRHLQPLAKDGRALHANMITNYYKKQISRGWLLAKADGFQNETATNDDITDVIHKWSRFYKDAERTDEYLKSVRKIQYECALDNNSFFAMLHDVKDDTDYSGDKNMQHFLLILAKKLGVYQDSQKTTEQKQEISKKEAAQSPEKKPSFGRVADNIYSDDLIRRSINRICKECQDENTEMHFQAAKQLQQELGLSNDDLGKSISKAFAAIVKYSGPRTMQEFFSNLGGELTNKANEKATALAG